MTRKKSIFFRKAILENDKIFTVHKTTYSTKHHVHLFIFNELKRRESPAERISLDFNSSYVRDSAHPNS